MKRRKKNGNAKTGHTALIPIADAGFRQSFLKKRMPCVGIALLLRADCVRELHTLGDLVLKMQPWREQ
jgi:hypothetical protein